MTGFSQTGLAAPVAVRELLDTLPLRSMLSTVAIALLLTVVTGLWTFRAAGVHYILRYDAFKTRNEWVGVLKARRASFERHALGVVFVVPIGITCAHRAGQATDRSSRSAIGQARQYPCGLSKKR